IGGILPMTIIRQPSLFSIQELYGMEPTQKYDAIISAINMDAIYYEISKKSRFGAPTELNYAAMIISIFIRYVERIPTIKDLIKRRNNGIAFRLNSRILVSSNIRSESLYNCHRSKLSECSILYKVHEQLRIKAITERFIIDDTIAIDATHFEARDQAPPKEEKAKYEPKKRGRKSKQVREQWLTEQAAKEANKPLYEKT